MNPRSASAGLVAVLLFLAGVAIPGCQRPSVEEAVATNTEVRQGSYGDSLGGSLGDSREGHVAHLGIAADGQAPSRGGSPAEARDIAADEAADLARIRAGTALYQHFDRAVAAGFVDPGGVTECVAHPEFGGMGVHFVNFDRYATLEIDPARPEILLYEPREDGSMRLVGVEFAVNAEAWHAAGNEGLPSVAGAAYDPPNPEAESPIVQSSYTLHVWTWQSNPNGRFHPFNPRVRCPGAQAGGEG
jgi:hypothetical protein